MNWRESRGDPHTSTAGWEVLLTLIEAYMTPIHCDLYTTFSFTWVWPWRNVAPQIYMSAIISALQLISPLLFSTLVFFPFCMQPISLSLSLSLSISLSLFCSFLSPPVPQQRGARVNQARPFSFARPWLVLMMFPKRWKGQLRGHRSCSPHSPLADLCLSLLFFSSLPPLPLVFSLPHFQHYQYRSRRALRTFL